MDVILIVEMKGIKTHTFSSNREAGFTFLNIVYYC